METKKKIALNKLQELKLYMKIMTCRWCCVCFGCSLPVFYLLLHLMCLNIPEESSLMSRSDQDVYYYLCVFTIWSKSTLTACEWVFVWCICVRLTGGPAGPGGPLLSWVQVQALGMAGQSASFLWMTTAWWGWHEDNKPMKKGKKKRKTERKKKSDNGMNW